MDITLHTKVSELLEVYPDLEARLLELSPIFSKLRNLMLRRTVAKITSLQQAAVVAGISPVFLITELRKAAGLSEVDLCDDMSEDSEIAPDWFDVEKIVCRYDACPVIESGKSPMQDILKLASDLREDQILQVVTPFKPVPIIEKLRAKGFSSWSRGQDNFFRRNDS